MNRRRALKRRAFLALPGAVALLAVAAIVVYASSAAGPTAAKNRGKKSFSVRGGVTAKLQPGMKLPLNVQIRNNRQQTIWITRLVYSIGVDSAHVARGCTVQRDFKLRQLPVAAFPIKVPAAKSGRRLRYRSLRRLHVRYHPMLSMKYLRRTNQDACQGASISIRYSGSALLAEPSMAGVDTLDDPAAHLPR